MAQTPLTFDNQYLSTTMYSILEDMRSMIDRPARFIDDMESMGKEEKTFGERLVHRDMQLPMDRAARLGSSDRRRTQVNDLDRRKRQVHHASRHIDEPVLAGLGAVPSF